MTNIFRKIWLTPWLREAVLLLVATLGAVLGTSLLDLTSALEDPLTPPLDDLSTWASATGLLLFITLVKQVAVIIMTNIAKVVITTTTRAAGPPPMAPEVTHGPPGITNT